jgi:hypothetical protein
MATLPTGIPTPIDKRNMLYAPDPKKPFDGAVIGDSFVAAGRLCEGLDFYERVADAKTRDERIARVKATALTQGDAFLLGRVAAKGFVPVSKDEWRQAAVTARSAGMIRHALRAAIQAGEEALMAELRAQLGDAVPAALAAPVIAESPEQAKSGATHPGMKVEAVAATGAAHIHDPSLSAPAGPKPNTAGDGDGAKAPA